ncbi:MAG: right-handed parallel beta-helix repeat-containing protein, partial [Planctomycetota bacterium]
MKWIGTDSDSSDALTNTVTMDSDKTVTVEFVEYVGKTMTVPNDYRTIQEAVYNAKEGDTIIVDQGTYFGGYQAQSLVVDLPITITSKNPDDPNCVAATIIDGYDYTTQASPWSLVGVRFTSNTDSRTVLNGITIQNCGGHWSNGLDGDRSNGFPDGVDGASGQGAAIYVENGASPIIKNCILRDNLIEGGDGGDGANGATTGTFAGHAGRGGWSGWAHGAGIYCAPDSSPQFINCVIEDNVARGGNGGDGGDASGAAGPNYGGNWSVERAFHFDSIGFGIWYVEGPLWEFWEWDWAPVYAPIYDVNLVSYFGDYRWYSGYGGGAYCDIGSNVSFVNCEIRGNRAEGGMSGVGGQPAMEPYVAYEIPSFGAGVYCAVDSVITFTDCTFEDNIASALTVGITDPNHRLDPYSGYGGGVCAEDSASVVFVNCDFVGNEADTGGGMYTDNTDVTIIDSNLASNTALRGGGFVGANGLINITGTEIANNSAIADINDPNVDAYYGNGAGLFCWLGGINIRDCNISGNIADYSGGGVYLRDVNTASLVNNLITNNEAGRDGGGVSANWFTRSVISNCTFAGNDATGNFGEPNNSGFGGGLYNSYESNSVITDSIFWNNFALKGDAILVGTDFRFDKRPSTVTISYSDIGQASIWVDDESTLNWGDGNIEADPLFTQGPRGGYYLSQIGAGQTENSPAVDAGSDYASYVGMVGYTTRTDEILDAGRVDMGYHHPGAEPCRLCDLVLDGVINLCDFAVLAERWLDDTCSEGNNWCNGADLTSDMYVDM